MERNWYLTGMMGAGKTTVGRKLASLADRDFIDLDEQISNVTGMGIPELFAALGEAEFRIQESQELQKLPASGLVVATAGGSILSELNRQHMRNTGTTIYLRAHPGSLIERLGQERAKRPLLSDENWTARLEALYDQRRDLYEQADIIIDTASRTSGDVTELVLQKLKELEGKPC
jgi:shikimate kinase